MSKEKESPARGRNNNPQHAASSEVVPRGGALEQVKDRWQVGAAGCIVEKGIEGGVRVALWVVKERKKALYNTLVGFLNSNAEGLEDVATWLETWWGKMAQNIQMLDAQVVCCNFLHQVR